LAGNLLAAPQPDNMNTASNARPAPVTGRMHRAFFWLAAGLLFATFSPSSAQTNTTNQVTVKTLGGGPLKIGGPSNGYVDGPTLQQSQFNYPIVSAIDPDGFLYVADRDNGVIRKLDVPGDRSTTYLPNTTTYTDKFAEPVAIVFDRGTNLYVLNQGDGTVRKFDRFANLLNTFVGLNSPTAFALDTATNLYVTELGGAVKRITPTGLITTLRSGFVEPSGIAIISNLFAAITENHAVRLLNLANPTIVTLVAGSSSAGFRDGPGELARFDTPEHIAVAPSGILVVADHFNHRVRLVDLNGTVSTLYGIDQSRWASDYPGWEDSPPGGGVDFVEAREPVGVTVARDGTIYTSEVFYHIIRRATASSLTAPPGGVAPGGTNVVPVVPPAIIPIVGFFPSGQTVVITSSVPDVRIFFTTDRTTPTTNSLEVTNLVCNEFGCTGTIEFREPLRDLTSLCIRAFQGTNASETVCGVSAAQNEIGIPRDVTAGIGATPVIPVVVNLRSNDTLRSLQFRVEVTPNSSSMPPISENFRPLSISSNDFIRVATSTESEGVSTFDAAPYTLTNGTVITRGWIIAFIGTNANFSVKNFAVVTMLAVPIPPDVSTGDSYRIRVLEPSGTFDGQQGDVDLARMSARNITIANISYLVGDSSPAGWYNAGDFGNDDLKNSDVNSAFVASLGSRLPYVFSDLLDAMDSWPEDTPDVVGGDGHIRFLDWQLTQLRSLRLETNNWRRAWSPGGVRKPQRTTLNASPNRPAQMQTLTPGNVWLRQALVGAKPIENALIQTEVSVPVYTKVAPGFSVSGFEFRALVAADGNAPPLGEQVRFVAAEGMRIPQTVNFAINEVGCAWSLGSFNPPLQGSNLVGSIRFKIPVNAPKANCYTVSFANADGAPDLKTQYNFETLPASVWIESPAPRMADFISFDWKTNFFGSATNSLAQADGDPDGDGVPNWAEYLAGTDPTSALSRLRLFSAERSQNGTQTGIALRWLSASGHKYLVESSNDLRNWTPLASDLLGTGEVSQVVDTNTTHNVQFYRVRVEP
jgi:hypothetical protein